MTERLGLDRVKALYAAKDLYLASHAQGTMLLAEMLARRLGLSPREVERARVAGFLHDVGKLAVSDAVLGKPGKLDMDDWAEMRQHPKRGWDLLAPVFTDGKDILDAVVAHHERMDGSGYPFGLRGDEIPFLARLIAVADAMDALLGARPYRGPLPLREAAGVLLRDEADKFDLDILAALGAAIGVSLCSMEPTG